MGTGGGIDIADLSWEDRERVRAPPAVTSSCTAFSLHVRETLLLAAA